MVLVGVQLESRWNEMALDGAHPSVLVALPSSDCDYEDWAGSDWLDQ